VQDLRPELNFRVLSKTDGRRFRTRTPVARKGSLDAIPLPAFQNARFAARSQLLSRWIYSRLFRKLCTTTTKRRNRPRSTHCHQELILPSRLKTLKRTPRSSTP